MTNLGSILKSINSFADKCPYSQSYGFSRNQVQMWELDCREGWAPKNWCFQTVVLEKTLESLLDCKEIKSANPKVNHLEYLLEGLMLLIFWALMWRAGSLEKTLMLRRIKGRRRRGWQRMRWLDSIADSMDMNLSKLHELVESRGAWQGYRSQRIGHDLMDIYV